MPSRYFDARCGSSVKVSTSCLKIAGTCCRYLSSSTIRSPSTRRPGSSLNCGFDRCDAHVLVERHPDRAFRRAGEARNARIRQLADGVHAAQQHAAVEPVTRPVVLRFVVHQPGELFDGNRGAPLDEDARLAELAFEKDVRQRRIAAGPELRSAERAAAMEDVARAGVEIQAGRAVLVVERTGAVGVRFQVRADPVTDRHAGRRVDDELDLGGEGPGLARVG